MPKDEMRNDRPPRPGEYWELLEVSEQRIKGALERAKQDIERVCLTLEAFLQGECYIHGVRPDVGDMSSFIREEKSLLEEKASDTLGALLKRVDMLESGS